jgi:hypothetical protein
MVAKKTTSKKDSSSQFGLGLGAGLAVAAGLVGAYLLYGKDGAKNRKKIKGWALKMKGEVLEKLETMKDVSEDSYNALVDTVAAKYYKVKSVDDMDVDALAKKIKGQWKQFKKEYQSVIEKPVVKKKK